MALLLGAGSPGPADIEQAAAALSEAQLVAFPTETVYGLGADAANPAAVAGIFAAKGRPVGHPLIVHLAHQTDLERFGRNISASARKLSSSFWPGPLTLVVERSDLVAPETVGGMETVGLRVPDHPVALALLTAFGGGVAAPSANRFGSVSPTTAQHVIDDLGSLVDIVLDGGPSTIGVESTIVDVTGDEPQLLRPGGISQVEIEAVLGRPLVDGRRGQSRAPGMMASHYAPRTELILVDADELPDRLAAEQRAGRRVGLIGPAAPSSTAGVAESTDLSHWPLSARSGPYAAGLYSALRDADRAGLDRLLITAPETGPLLDAVMDRLVKATTPRP